MTVIRLVQCADGSTEHCGEYLSDYEILGSDGAAIVESTPHKALAIRFVNLSAALEFWRQSKGTRPDGKPNRPLTAYTITFEEI